MLYYRPKKERKRRKNMRYDMTAKTKRIKYHIQRPFWVFVSFARVRMVELRRSPVESKFVCCIFVEGIFRVMYLRVVK
jgi:hypothetical protein